MAEERAKRSRDGEDIEQCRKNITEGLEKLVDTLEDMGNIFAAMEARHKRYRGIFFEPENDPPKANTRSGALPPPSPGRR